MNDEEYMELQDPRQISQERLRKLIRHLGKATESLKQKKNVQSREKFVKKIEELSGERLPNEPASIQDIETKLKRLEDLEKRDQEENQHEEKEIHELQEAVLHEDKDIESMSSKIQLLEKRLAESELKRLRQLKDNKDKMFQLAHMLSDLNLKLSGVEKKHKEMRARKRNSNEVKAIKKQLSALERLHSKLKKSKKNSKGDLERVKNKINELKAAI